MIPASFAYTAPTSIEAVLALLARRPDEVKVMAGGQSLIPLLRFRLAGPEAIVDLRRLTELRSVEDAGTTFRIGAMVTHRDILESIVATAWQVIRDGGADLADPLVRNRGTFGGSIAHADPAGDWPPIALALDATMHVRNLQASREVRADDFFTDLFTTAISPEELLTHIDLPKPRPSSVSAYVKVPHPASGYAVAGAAAVLDIADGVCRSARIAVTGVAVMPLRARAAEAALVGSPVTAGSIDKAGAVAADGIDVIGDAYAPQTYRRNLVGIVVRRALQRAADGVVHPPIHS